MKTISFSSNEIFTIARTAIRGAGWGQGAAEDGARAATFLAQIGLDGIKAVMDAVESHLNGSRTLQQGLAAIDHLLAGECSRVELMCLDAPLLQWGLCCLASHEMGIKIGVRAISKKWEPVFGQKLQQNKELEQNARFKNRAFCSIIKEKEFIIFPEQAKNGLFRGADLMIVRCNKTLTNYPPACKNLRSTAIEEATLTKAKQLAHNTYVPASATSRQYGAGSIKSDND